ncbi:MAG TPA: restriction endonuclease subunit S [Alphaproteobacteria bacterium]|nr:restriction endonuclease subunit S [Alphaproteobacteria bacterium]
MPQNIGDNRVIEDDIARISPEDARRLSRYLVQQGDIVYSRRGDVERRALIRAREEGWLCGTGCLRVRFGNKGVNPVYASYYLGHPSVREWIVRHAHGATMPNLNTSILSALPFVIPSLEEQRAIAHILGTLDDKIELNRRMNETLEAMARALFKSWFVDFDPVRAKAESRDPGLPKDIADLFPDQLVDSELGEIPAGWGARAIGELADIVGGSTPSTSKPEFWEGGTHCWATPKDLASLKAPVLLDTERHVTDAGLAQISSGLLPAGTVLLSSRAPIGYLAVAEVPVAINQGFIAMKPKPDISNLFLLFWARSAQEDILSRANGSTFLEISKSNFRRIPVVCPTNRILAAFDSIARPLYQQILANERESRTLAALRDTLLPKLISGDLRIEDAERFLKERGL